MDVSENVAPPQQGPYLMVKHYVKPTYLGNDHLTLITWFHTK